MAKGYWIARAALACYRSEGYQEAIRIRQPVSQMDFLIIEGYGDPQPQLAS